MCLFIKNLFTLLLLLSLYSTLTLCTSTRSPTHTPIHLLTPPPHTHTNRHSLCAVLLKVWCKLDLLIPRLTELWEDKLCGHQRRDPVPSLHPPQSQSRCVHHWPFTRARFRSSPATSAKLIAWNVFHLAVRVQPLSWTVLPRVKIKLPPPVVLGVRGGGLWRKSSYISSRPLSRPVLTL